MPSAILVSQLCYWSFHRQHFLPKTWLLVFTATSRSIVQGVDQRGRAPTIKPSYRRLTDMHLKRSRRRNLQEEGVMQSTGSPNEAGRTLLVRSNCRTATSHRDLSESVHSYQFRVSKYHTEDQDFTPLRLTGIQLCSIWLNSMRRRGKQRRPFSSSRCLLSPRSLVTPHFHISNNSIPQILSEKNNQSIQYSHS